MLIASRLQTLMAAMAINSWTDFFLGEGCDGVAPHRVRDDAARPIWVRAMAAHS